MWAPFERADRDATGGARLSEMVAALIAGMFLPAADAAVPIVTLVEGHATVYSAGRNHGAAPGLRLRECDVLRTGPSSLLQLEPEDGSALALGGDGSSVVVDIPDAPGARDTHVLLNGWAKFTVPPRPRPVPLRLNTAHFDVEVTGGTVVVHVGDKVGELFVERGSAHVLERPAKGAGLTVPAGRYYARIAGTPGATSEDRASQAFLAAMPRAFRDSLPALRRGLVDREPGVLPASESPAAELPVSSLPELRACLGDETLRRVQEALRHLGHPVGPADGIPGPRTRAALRAFQAAHGLTPSGTLDAETLRAIEINDRP